MIRGCDTSWSKNNSAIYIFNKKTRKNIWKKNKNNVYTFCSILTTKENDCWRRQISTCIQKRISHNCAGTVKCGPNYRTLPAPATHVVRIYCTLQLVEIGGVDADFVIYQRRIFLKNAIFLCACYTYLYYVRFLFHDNTTR